MPRFTADRLCTAQVSDELVSSGAESGAPTAQQINSEVSEKKILVTDDSPRNLMP